MAMLAAVLSVDPVSCYEHDGRRLARDRAAGLRVLDDREYSSPAVLSETVRAQGAAELT